MLVYNLRTTKGKEAGFEELLSLVEKGGGKQEEKVKNPGKKRGRGAKIKGGFHTTCRMWKKDGY